MARKKKSEASQARSFGIITSVALAVVGVWLQWKGGTTGAVWTGSLGVGVLILTLAVAPVWLGIFRLWMRFAVALSKVTTTIFLTLFYYLVVTPMGLGARLIARRPLDVGWRDEEKSYWVGTSRSEYSIDRYSKMY